MRTGTLARILVHAGLTGDAPALRTAAAHAALDRLVERSRRGVPADAVDMVVEAGISLDPQR
ncbi:MAG: hypothetical protein H0T99_12375 [Geodermatophilaceae bacterium]|nr:hypothetical protein [Geodermatophilaceae bacterium]